MTNLNTKSKITWCPGCFNFQILNGFKNFINEEIKNGKRKEDFAIVSGIGCHGKIFDYVNLNGINALHGRVLPAFGIKIGNPNLDIFGFSGDGDSYCEGMEHLIHAARYNSNITLLVHNNQIFALTIGQSTSTTETNYKDKINPEGNKLNPINPIKIMLSADASFVARVFAESKQIEEILEQTKKHKGFKFIEILQPCLIFHPDKNYKDHFYNLQNSGHDKTNFQEAFKKSLEWDYNEIKEDTKIPLGIFYQKQRETFEEKYWQLKDLVKNKNSWKDLKR